MPNDPNEARGKKALCFCRYHRSACTKTRPYSRVVPRRKKGDEHPPPRGR
ncbi:hypothetical protein TNCV_2814681, partial [Trichonephila clavipes]